MNESADTGVVPLFYGSIHPLDRMGDKDRRLVPFSDRSFAAATNAIPLVADEFLLAEAHYPIVFAGTTTLQPVAVVGLRTAENLFIDYHGTWDTDTYVPRYVRRYPFILIKGDDQRLHLGIDAAAHCWSTNSGEALFAAGEPTAVKQNAIGCCIQFHRQLELAKTFSAALHEHAVLVEHRFSVTGLGHAHTVTGCHIVSEEKLAAVPDAVFLDWRRAGWLPLITAHLLSLRHWQALGRLAAERPAAALAA